MFCRYQHLETSGLEATSAIEFICSNCHDTCSISERQVNQHPKSQLENRRHEVFSNDGICDLVSTMSSYIHNFWMAFLAPVPLGSKSPQGQKAKCNRVHRKCCAQATNQGYSAVRFSNFRERWSGEWNGYWQQVDSLGNAIKTAECVRNLKSQNVGTIVHQENWVEDPTWHRDNTLRKEYTHTATWFENAPMLTTVHENGDGLQVSIGRFGGLEKTVHHPTRDDVRTAIVLLYATGAGGCCTYQREARDAPYESFWDKSTPKTIGRCRAIRTRVERQR